MDLNNMSPTWNRSPNTSRYGDVCEYIKFGVFSLRIVYRSRDITLVGKLLSAYITIKDTMNDCVVFSDIVYNHTLEETKEIAVGRFGIWAADMRCALTGANKNYLEYTAARG